MRKKRPLTKEDGVIGFYEGMRIGMQWELFEAIAGHSIVRGKSLFTANLLGTFKLSTLVTTGEDLCVYLSGGALMNLRTFG